MCADCADSPADVPQRELLKERAELLYGQAKFKPLSTVDSTVKATAAAPAPVVAGVPSA